jgi:nucleotide-binding universal stress UspA family protein
MKTLVVPHEGTAQDDAALRLACQTARGTGARVLVVAVTRVHPSLPLEGLPPSIDADARDALDHAAEIARGEGCLDVASLIEGRLVRARDVAEAIVAEAREVGAEAIYMALSYRRHPWQRWGTSRTLRAVLRHAPCRVVLDSARETGIGQTADVLSLEAYRDARQAQ